MLESIIALFLPPLCHCCKAYIPHAGRVHLCAECLQTSSPVHSPLCPVCGVSFLTGGGIDHLCGRCIASPPSYDKASAPFVYEGAIRDLVHMLKYDRKIQCRRPLGLLMAERLSESVMKDAPELIIPVPLHLKRLRQRGFNQAILLGEVLSREWGIHLERKAMIRTRWTEPQINLAAAERAANVKGAFEVAEPGKIKGRMIVLVDDVMTTGSTVSECAKVLKKAGAAGVHVVTVARVP